MIIFGGLNSQLGLLNENVQKKEVSKIDKKEWFQLHMIYKTKEISGEMGTRQKRRSRKGKRKQSVENNMAEGKKGRKIVKMSKSGLDEVRFFL